MKLTISNESGEDIYIDRMQIDAVLALFEFQKHEVPVMVHKYDIMSRVLIENLKKDLYPEDKKVVCMPISPPIVGTDSAHLYYEYEKWLWEEHAKMFDGSREIRLSKRQKLSFNTMLWLDRYELVRIPPLSDYEKKKMSASLYFNLEYSDSHCQPQRSDILVTDNGRLKKLIFK